MNRFISDFYEIKLKQRKKKEIKLAPQKEEELPEKWSHILYRDFYEANIFYSLIFFNSYFVIFLTYILCYKGILGCDLTDLKFRVRYLYSCVWFKSLSLNVFFNAILNKVHGFSLRGHALLAVNAIWLRPKRMRPFF